MTVLRKKKSYKAATGDDMGTTILGTWGQTGKERLSLLMPDWQRRKNALASAGSNRGNLFFSVATVNAGRGILLEPGEG